VDDIRHFLHNQRAALKRVDLEKFLSDMICFFRELSTSKVLQGSYLPSREFDAMCQAAGQLSAFELLCTSDDMPDGHHDIILVTELFCMGGHAELVRDIIRQSKVPILLVATNINGRKDPVLEAFFDEANILSIIEIEESSLTNKLRRLQSLLTNPNVGKVCILTHAYDAVAISAIESNKKSALFFHHCDHTPSLGCYLDGVHHIDLHNIGFLRCRHELSLQDNRYLCMTSMNLKSPRDNWNFSDPCLKTASCGGMHKISAMPYHIKYSDVVLHVLKKYGGTHFHIGFLDKSFLEEIYSLMAQNGLQEDQFVYIGEAPNLPDILTQLEVDLYLPTLPLSGGKAVIDVMCAGIPILVHQHACDRLLCSLDLIYPTALTWSTIDEFDRALEQFNQAFWLNQARESRAYFERYHSPALFVDHLEKHGVSVDSGDVPEMKLYQPEIAQKLAYAGFRQQ
jgi:hypothetical protein